MTCQMTIHAEGLIYRDDTRRDSIDQIFFP